MIEATVEQVKEQKAIQFKALEQKLAVIQGHNAEISLEISYTLDLVKEDQIYYAKLGTSLLYRDLHGYSSSYKNDDPDPTV